MHEGKEAYPEVAAYRSFLGEAFICEEVHPDELSSKEDLGEAICWMIMGYYPKTIKAHLVVHDYRSLSVGRGRWLKDKIKRYTNAVPDIRIFQNEAMAQLMGFSDDLPLVYLPMGVPSFILKEAMAPKEEANCDFCYIGVMSEERRTYLMFDSFIKRFGRSKSFHAYGTPEESIVNRYADYPNIVFAGRHEQDRVFSALKRSSVAVNYFPEHFPHALQTPTKLLEYGALGLRILCNEHPQSRLTSERYGLSCFWGQTHDMFKDVSDDLDWPDNNGFDPTPMLWPSVLVESGIVAKLQEVLKKK